MWSPHVLEFFGLWGSDVPGTAGLLQLRVSRRFPVQLKRLNLGGYGF